MGQVALPKGAANEGLEFNGTMFTEVKLMGIDENGYFHFSADGIVPNIENYTFLVLGIFEKTQSSSGKMLPWIRVFYNRMNVMSGGRAEAYTENSNRYGISLICGKESFASAFGGVDFGYAMPLGDISFRCNADGAQAVRVFVGIGK